jgi:hypothetical protein
MANVKHNTMFSGGCNRWLGNFGSLVICGVVKI